MRFSDFYYRCKLPLGVLTLLLFIAGSSNGQIQSLEIFPTIGFSARSTPTGVFDFRGVNSIDPTLIYSDEANLQGFSFNPGIQFRWGKVGLEYYPNLRYDAIYSKLSTGSSNDYVKEFIVDHNINVLFRGRRIDYGLGISVINAGKGFVNPYPDPRYIDIQFNTYNIFMVIPIKKIIHLELMALYIPRNLPSVPDKDAMMLNLRVYYKFDFLNKKTTGDQSLFTL